MSTQTIIQGDCVEVMRGMEADSINLTVTSPPYDNIRDYKGFSFDFESLAKELLRVTKQGGVVVWVVGDQTIDGDETGTSFKQALFFKEVGFKLHDTMIYDKGKVVFPDSNRYHPCFEYMFVLSKGSPKTFNPIADRINKYPIERKRSSFRQKDGSIQSKETDGTPERGVRYNIWQYPNGYMQTTKDEYAFDHPAMFPEALARDHILSWSNEGDTVLDPFLGSGTTLKMAKLANRNGIGIELSPEYIEIAKARLAQDLLF